MSKFLFIFLIFLSACIEEPEAKVSSSSKDEKVMDFNRLHPVHIEVDVFENSHVTNDLVFVNRDPSFRTSKKYLTRNEPNQKGFFVWHEGTWKAHGKWFFFSDGILQQRSFFVFGKKVGHETLYYGLGEHRETFRHDDGKIYDYWGNLVSSAEYGKLYNVYDPS